jgi:hypothetical protein
LSSRAARPPTRRREDGSRGALESGGTAESAENWDEGAQVNQQVASRAGSEDSECFEPQTVEHTSGERSEVRSEGGQHGAALLFAVDRPCGGQRLDHHWRALHLRQVWNYGGESARAVL